MKLNDLHKGDNFTLKHNGKTLCGFIEHHTGRTTKAFIYGQGIMFFKSSKIVNE